MIILPVYNNIIELIKFRKQVFADN